MTKKKIGRYTYYIIPENGTVKCVSSYAKLPVYGVAKCAPNDMFDEELGMRIARLRCDSKINARRYKNLTNALDYWSYWGNVAFDQAEFLEGKIRETEDEAENIKTEMEYLHIV